MVDRVAHQIVTVPFATEIGMPVTIWVVAGPFATTQQTALTLWQTAQQSTGRAAWACVIAPLEIVDATTNPRQRRGAPSHAGPEPT